MKRLLAVLLASMILFLLIACGRTDHTDLQRCIVSTNIVFSIYIPMNREQNRGNGILTVRSKSTRMVL